MSLTPSFNRVRKTMAVAATSLSLAFLAGCGQPANKIGGDARDQSLRGSTTAEQVFTGGPTNSPHTTIDGVVLRAGQRYVVDGTLTINGNVPDRTTIEVNNGRLTVTGDVGNQSRIDVQLPIITHDETTTMLMPMTTSCGQNCTMTTMMVMPVTNTIIDGLKYPNDTRPAVTIGGVIGTETSISSNGRTVATGWDATLRVQASHGARRNQVGVATPPRPGS